jgi:integrase/recombinase XerD
MRITLVPDSTDCPGGYCFRDREERLVEVAVDFSTYLRNSPRRLSIRAEELYSKALNQLCIFLEDHTVFGRETVDEALSELSRTAINASVRRLQLEGKAAATVRLYASGVREFCRWASTDESKYFHKKPLFAKGERLDLPHPPSTLARTLPFGKVVDLAVACRHEAQRLAIHAHYDTGLRISELPRVMRSDLPDLQRYPPEWNYFGLLVQKGSKGRRRQFKERATIMTRALLARIARHHNSKAYRSRYGGDDKSAPAFTNVFGEPWTVDALESLMRKAKRRAGFDEAHVHMLRHGFAYSVLASDHGKSAVDRLVVAQQTLGHAHLKTTQRYTQVPAELIPQLLDALGSRELQARFEQSQEMFERTYLPARKEPPVRQIRSAA